MNQSSVSKKTIVNKTKDETFCMPIDFVWRFLLIAWLHWPANIKCLPIFLLDKSDYCDGWANHKWALFQHDRFFRVGLTQDWKTLLILLYWVWRLLPCLASKILCWYLWRILNQIYPMRVQDFLKQPFHKPWNFPSRPLLPSVIDGFHHQTRPSHKLSTILNFFIIWNN